MLDTSYYDSFKEIYNYSLISLIVSLWHTNISSFLKIIMIVSKMEKSLGWSSSKWKITSTLARSTSLLVSNDYKTNYQEGHDHELEDYANKMEESLEIDDEEDKPLTPIGVIWFHHSSTRSQQ